MTSSFATPVLSLSVLGHFSAILPEGREATIPTRKAQALLTYLALNPAQRFGRAGHAAGEVKLVQKAQQFDVQELGLCVHDQGEVLLQN